MNTVTLEIAVPTNYRKLEIGETLLEGDKCLQISDVSSRTLPAKDVVATRVEAVWYNTTQPGKTVGIDQPRDAQYIRRIT